MSQIEDFVVTPAGAIVYNETAMEQPELRAASSDRKIAIYAPDDLSFGMARLIASVASSSGVEMMVYRGLNEALSYVGIEKYPLEQIKNDKSEI